MGAVYRRQVRVCTTCQQRLDTTVARRRCEAAGHAIAVRSQGPWWMRYTVDGALRCVSTHCDTREDAERRLRVAEGAPAPRHRRIAPVESANGTLPFEDAAEPRHVGRRCRTKIERMSHKKSLTGTGEGRR